MISTGKPKTKTGTRSESGEQDGVPETKTSRMHEEKVEVIRREINKKSVENLRTKKPKEVRAERTKQGGMENSEEEKRELKEKGTLDRIPPDSGAAEPELDQH